jgi:hypothetical protein
VSDGAFFDGSSEPGHSDLPIRTYGIPYVPRERRDVTQAIAVRRAFVFRTNVTTNARTERSTSDSEYGATGEREEFERPEKPADLAKHACIDRALLDRIAWAIRETSAVGPDLWNRWLFRFARAIKAFIPPTIPDAMIRDIAWLRFQRTEITRAFPETLADFTRAWNYPGKHFRGDYYELICRKYAESTLTFPGLRACNQADQLATRFMFHAGLIYARRPAFEGTFHMDLRRIGAAIGTPRATTSLILGRIADAGLIQLVKKGVPCPTAGRSNRWRLTGALD